MAASFDDVTGLLRERDKTVAAAQKFRIGNNLANKTQRNLNI
jgi:hypothetical protein